MNEWMNNNKECKNFNIINMINLSVHENNNIYNYIFIIILKLFN